MKYLKYLLGALTAVFGFTLASAQCPPGQTSVTIDVTTDSWGYEGYWEIVPVGNACGTGTVWSGGNTNVGCNGGGLQVASGTDPGAYPSSTTTNVGPQCIANGCYDFIEVDDWGDGGSTYDIFGDLSPVATVNAAGPGSTTTICIGVGNELSVTSTFFNTSADSTEMLYFTQIPSRQAVQDSLLFGAGIHNGGTDNQPNTYFKTTVSGAMTWSDSASLGTIVAGNSTFGDITKIFHPNGVGTYNVDFETFSDSTDANPANNILTHTFDVVDSVYARDDENTSQGQGWWYGAGVNYEIGNSFYFWVNDTATSISYYNLTSTANNIGIAGNTFSLVLYNLNDLTTPLASAAFHTVTTAEENAWITLPFDAGNYALTPGVYVATMEALSDMLFTSSQDQASMQTVFVDPDNTGTWYYTTRIPWIRLNTTPSNCPTIAANSTSTVASCGGSDGTATVNPSGALTPYTYLWDAAAGSQTTATATGLAASYYYVTITDAGGCTSIATVTVNNPASGPSAVPTATDAACNGSCDGSADAVASGGASPYTYLWDDSGAQTTVTATGLCSGNYNVTVTDANSCFTTASVFVGEPAAVSGTAMDTATSCNGSSDGSAVVSASGGTSPYSYLWDAAAGNQTTATATGLAAGTYNVTITDTNSCVGTVSVTVSEPTAVSGTATMDIGASSGSSADGGATVTASGGTSPYTYNWSNGETTASATGLSAGTATVTITDSNGCTSTANVNITIIGVKENTLTTAVSLYPNPNNGMFTLSFSDVANDTYQVEVRNVIGQLIFSDQYSVGGNFSKNLDMSSVDKGMYFISIRNSEDQLTKLVIIK